ncbi:AAA family ATPase [Devosia sp. ZB163]|uniref:AAA family ATPase n=1 Tax=Devosia sp. ZB163 TaxID=3025938 RepID=UPI00236230B2|nr:AAA family ATPase [Devosia sp. ZB163]MDC9825536.1 AAA family ATPase [Devosia sp. ZB163]
MTLTDIEIKGFRSVRRLRMPLRQLTVLIGGNGVGKTNLYRSIELLHAAALGRLADEIAREGGLASIFWAGGRNLTDDGRFDARYRTDGYRKSEGGSRLTLEARLEIDDFAPTYGIELGFPSPYDAAFSGEAQIKSEFLDIRSGKRDVRLLERTGPAIWARGAQGEREIVEERALASETALSTLRGGYPEIATVRQELGNWRFFHGFRTDTDSPLRRPSRAITSPILASDGSNLAAVFATLRHIRHETVDLDAAIDLAFPGTELVVPEPGEFATFGLIFPETPKRTFWAHELSDGTLQFLALMGALLSYRLPPFVALNEPETSLHPNLLPALAQTIVKAAGRAQVWVVTHSQPLADAIAEESGVAPREVIRTEEGTGIRGLSPIGVFDDE